VDQELVRVLLVEDDRADQMAVERLVKKEGLPYDLVIAETVAEAIARLKEGRLDLALIDYKLPDGSGLGVQKHVGDTPCIFLTGVADLAIAVRAMKAGAFDFLIKDQAHDYLQLLPVTIENAIRRRQDEDELRRYREHLEEMVEERTAELTRAKERLEAEIAERVRAEEELRESEENFRSLAENANDGIVIAAAHSGDIVYVNERYAQITGYTASELLGINIWDLSPSDETETLMDRSQRRLEGMTPPSQYETALIRKDGQRVPLEVTIAQMQWQRQTAFMGVVRDITERRRAEEALKEYSERLEEMVEERTQELRDAQEQLIRQEKLATLGQLAGAMGHELRNPLGAISNAAYYLNLVLEDPRPEVKETLEILNREVRTSEKIISSLLDYARRRPPVRQTVNVNAIVREALSRAGVPANIQVMTDLDETLPAIQADPDQLAQVFDNLIRNAVQAMPDGGVISIQSSVISEQSAVDGELITDHWLLITVRDTGIGIPPENMGKLFEPLFTTKAKGIGLGLALCKMLVEGHGGTIEVESEVGKGSTFKVKLI